MNSRVIISRANRNLCEMTIPNVIPTPTRIHCALKMYLTFIVYFCHKPVNEARIWISAYF